MKFTKIHITYKYPEIDKNKKNIVNMIHISDETESVWNKKDLINYIIIINTNQRTSCLHSFLSLKCNSTHTVFHAFASSQSSFHASTSELLRSPNNSERNDVETRHQHMCLIIFIVAVVVLCEVVFGMLHVIRKYRPHTLGFVNKTTKHAIHSIVVQRHSTCSYPCVAET